MRWLRLWLVLLLLLVSACTQYELVAPGRITLASGASVEATAAWNRVNQPIAEGNVIVWTRNGPILDSIIFVTGVADGEPIFRRRPQPGGGTSRDEPVAPFRQAMTSLEIRQLFEDTVTRVYRTPIVTTHNLMPMWFAGGDGFRFEMSLTGRDEVERQGIVYGTVRDDRLFLIWFQGTQLFHYPQLSPEVERLIGTLRFGPDA